MPQGNNDLISRIDQLLANDPFGARIASATVEAIAGLMAEDRSFLDAIMERTPLGQWIAVQYHPDGDWSVANAPLADDRKRIGELGERLIEAAESQNGVPLKLWDEIVANFRASLSKPLSDGE